jgi:hypothetical protein
MVKDSMLVESFGQKEWIDKLYRKSESKKTLRVVNTAISMFDYFCRNQGTTKEQMINRYQELFNQEKPDIRSICLSLDKFVNFMDEDHKEIIMNASIAPMPFKRKTSRTIKMNPK